MTQGDSLSFALDLPCLIVCFVCREISPKEGIPYSAILPTPSPEGKWIVLIVAPSISPLRWILPRNLAVINVALSISPLPSITPLPFLAASLP